MDSKTVLVTRPAGQASDSLCRRLRQAGFTVYSEPMLEIQALPELAPAARQMIQDLDHYQHVIFVSANAARIGLELIADRWPQLPVGVNCYAVGEATAAVLAGFGIRALTPGGNMTSEGLLALAPLADAADQRALIVKGEGGRDTLRAGLARRGAAVDELACYRRLCPTLPQGELAASLARWNIDAVVFSSGEAIVNFVELLRPAETTTLGSLCLVVPSERVARMARELGFSQVVTSANASDTAVLQALTDC